MSEKFKINLNSYLEGSKLNITKELEGFDLDMGGVTRKVVDFEEEASRRALVQLGWTPPSADKKSSKVLIFCVERKQYWKPEQQGYTFELSEAGLYPQDKAIKICTDANISGDNERMIDIEDAFTSLQKQTQHLQKVRRDADSKLDLAISLLQGG